MNGWDRYLISWKLVISGAVFTDSNRSCFELLKGKPASASWLVRITKNTRKLIRWLLMNISQVGTFYLLLSYEPCLTQNSLHFYPVLTSWLFQSYTQPHAIMPFCDAYLLYIYHNYIIPILIYASWSMSCSCMCC